MVWLLSVPGTGQGWPFLFLATDEMCLYFFKDASSQPKTHIVRIHGPPLSACNLNQACSSRRYHKREIEFCLRNAIFGTFLLLTLYGRLRAHFRDFAPFAL